MANVDTPELLAEFKRRVPAGIKPEDTYYDEKLGKFFPKEVANTRSLLGNVANSARGVIGGATSALTDIGKIPVVGQAVGGPTSSSAAGLTMLKGYLDKLDNEQFSTAKFSPNLAGKTLDVGSKLVAGAVPFVVPGGAVLGPASMALQGYGESRKAGGGVLPALTTAGIRAVEGSLNPGKGSGKLVKDIVKAAGIGGLGTGVGQLAENAVAGVSYDPQRKLDENLLPAAGMGAGLFGATTLGHAGVAKLADKMTSKPPVMNMGGSDNGGATGVVKPSTNPSAFMDLWTKLSGVKSQGEADALLATAGDLPPDRLAALKSRIPKSVSADVPGILEVASSGDKSAMAVLPTVGKHVANLQAAGIPITEADVKLLLDTAEKDRVGVVDRIKAERVKESRQNQLAKAGEQKAAELEAKQLQGEISTAGTDIGDLQKDALAKKEAAFAGKLEEKQLKGEIAAAGTDIGELQNAEKLKAEKDLEAKQLQGEIANAGNSVEGMQRADREKALAAANKQVLPLVDRQQPGSPINTPLMLSAKEAKAQGGEVLPPKIKPKVEIRIPQQTTAKEVTVPEKPETLAAQAALVKAPESPKAAVLDPQGQLAPEATAGQIRIDDPALGTLYLNRDKLLKRGLTTEQAQQLAKDGRIGELLGFSSEKKPAGGDTVVQTKTPAGTVVADEVVATPDQAAKATEAGKKLVPGAVIETKPAEVAIGERTVPKGPPPGWEEEQARLAMTPEQRNAKQLELMDAYNKRMAAEKSGKAPVVGAKVAESAETPVAEKAEVVQEPVAEEMPVLSTAKKVKAKPAPKAGTTLKVEKVGDTYEIKDNKGNVLGETDDVSEVADIMERLQNPKAEAPKMGATTTASPETKDVQVYHGTKAVFSEFKPAKLESNTGIAGLAEEGHHFTEHKQVADRYANAKGSSIDTLPAQKALKKRMDEIWRQQLAPENAGIKDTLLNQWADVRDQLNNLSTSGFEGRTMSVRLVGKFRDVDNPSKASDALNHGYDGTYNKATGVYTVFPGHESAIKTASEPLANQVKGMGAGLRNKPLGNEGGFIDLSSAVNSLRATVRPKAAVIKAFAKDNPIVQKAADVIERLPLLIERTRNLGEAKYKEFTKGFSPDELKQADEWIKILPYTKGVLPNVPPRVQSAIDHLQALNATMQAENVASGIKVKGADGTYREAEIVPWWTPQTFAKGIFEKSKDVKGEAELRAQLQDHGAKMGWTPDYTEEVFKRTFIPTDTKVTGVKEFGPLHKEMGVQYPPEWLAPLEERYRNYISKRAIDLELHRNVISDPELANFRNQLDNGEGGQHPTLDMAPSGGAAGTFNSALDDIMGQQGNSALDKVQTMLNHQIVGLMSGAKDAIQTTGKVFTMHDPRDAASALLETFMPGSFDKARQAGNLRSIGTDLSQLNPGVKGGVLDAILGVSEKLAHWQGKTKLNDYGYVLGAKAGEKSATRALADHDGQYFERFGILNPFTRPAPEVIAESAMKAQKFLTSAYNGYDLPSNLLKGSKDYNSYFGPAMRLARYSVGQMNQQYDHVIKPALRGDIKPLLVLATTGLLTDAAYNELKDYITSRKPSDLTWGEWLRLDKPDAARIMLAKLADAGVGGALTGYASGLWNGISGTGPSFGPKEVNAQLVVNGWNRTKAFLRALEDGQIEAEDWSKLGQDIVTDNVSDLRHLSSALRSPEKKNTDDQKRAEKLFDTYVNDKQASAVSVPEAYGINKRFRETPDPVEVSRLTDPMFRRALADKTLPVVGQAVRPVNTYYPFLEKLTGQPAQGQLLMDLQKELPGGLNFNKRAVLTTAQKVKEAAGLMTPEVLIKGTAKGPKVEVK